MSDEQMCRNFNNPTLTRSTKSDDHFLKLYWTFLPQAGIFEPVKICDAGFLFFLATRSMHVQYSHCFSSVLIFVNSIETQLLNVLLCSTANTRLCTVTASTVAVMEAVSNYFI